MAGAADCPDLPKGLAFSPPENDLTDVYLRRKIAGQALPVGGGLIHEVDVYSAEPGDLVKGRAHAPGTGDADVKQGVWYFFSPVRYAAGGRKINARGGGGGRKARTVAGDGGKRWHPECAPKPVKGGSAVGGYEQKFSYMVKDDASGKDRRAGWIMAEYGISPEHGGGDLVLCKIYQSTRSGPGASSSTTTSSSATTAAVPVSESESSSSSSSKKRKAAGDHPEAPTPSARPRQMDVDQDSHPPLPESLEPALTPEDADAGHHHRTADELAPPPPFSEQLGARDMMEEVESLYSHLFPNDGTTAPLPIVIDDGDQGMDWFGGDQGAPIAGAERDAAAGLVDHHHPAEVPPRGFWQQIEEEFESFYLLSKNGDTYAVEKDVDPFGRDLTAPPCAPAAETESTAAAAGLVQTITEDNAPCRNDDEANASLGEEGAPPDEPSADEVIYGLPCPGFSPAYINRILRTCAGGNFLPWTTAPASISLMLENL